MGRSVVQKIGLVARKPVFGVSDKATLKPVCSATETSYKVEISPVASLDMILFKKRITKKLIRLCGSQADLRLCCLQTSEDRFSRDEAQIILHGKGLFHDVAKFVVSCSSN